MLEAPPGAVFIWPVSCTVDYAHMLAKHLGRDDLVIECPSVFEDGCRRLRGRRLAGLVLDHACLWLMSDRQWDSYAELRRWVMVDVR
jgi:hypothetical protein